MATIITGGQAATGIALSKQTISSFQVSKVFPESSQDFSIDFDFSGDFCLTSAASESLHLYDCKLGKLKSTSYSKKYGCSLARFTHKPTNIIYASTKSDDAIRYMSFHDNKFIRYFKGHTKTVVSLEMSPQDDTFLSSSLDNTIRLWDLRSPNCQGLMHAPSTSTSSRPCIAFDQPGIVFAAGLQSKYLRLYDLKNFENGPFSSFVIQDPELRYSPEWTRIKFSNDGKYILICTRSDMIYIIDAYDGTIKHKLTGFSNMSGLDIEANFTPDAKFVYSGSENGNIYFWNVESGEQISCLEGHPEPTTAVGFNPKYMMMASADTKLAFWTP